jgi:hypothetical protein
VLKLNYHLTIYNVFYPGAKWHSRRKLLTPAFHFSILEQFVPIFSEKTRILIEKLKNAACSSPDGFDITPYITRCALDIICGITRHKLIYTYFSWLILYHYYSRNCNGNYSQRSRRFKFRIRNNTS